MYFYRRNIMEAQNDDILLLKLIKQDDQLAFKQVFYKYIDPLSHLSISIFATGMQRKSWSWIYFPLYGRTVLPSK